MCHRAISGVNEMNLKSTKQKLKSILKQRLEQKSLSGQILRLICDNGDGTEEVVQEIRCGTIIAQGTRSRTTPRGSRKTLSEIKARAHESG